MAPEPIIGNLQPGADHQPRLHAPTPGATMPSILEGTSPGSISVSSLGLICCNLSKYLGNLVLSRDFEWEAAGPAPT